MYVYPKDIHTLIIHFRNFLKIKNLKNYQINYLLFHFSVNSFSYLKLFTDICFRHLHLLVTHITITDFDDIDDNDGEQD